LNVKARNDPSPQDLSGFNVLAEKFVLSGMSFGRAAGALERRK
jgi:hypothetical protein